VRLTRRSTGPPNTPRSSRDRRPYVQFGNEKAIRDFGTGDDSRESFYSGHVTTAFYSAAFADRVMADVIGTAYPGYSLAENPIFRIGQGLALYGLAAGISYSRIAIDRHYMTDVLAGAGVGMLAGQLTYTYGYKKPRTTRPVKIWAMPGARGLQVSWEF
jgi:membrane-associated phospholipid phosphatase